MTSIVPRHHYTLGKERGRKRKERPPRLEALEVNHVSSRAPCPPYPNPHPLTMGAQHGSPNPSSVGSSPYSWRLWLNQLPQPLQPQVIKEGTSVGIASGCSPCFLSSWILGPVRP